MIPHPHERTGEDWSAEGQEHAQSLSWKLLRALVQTIKNGDTEAQLHGRLKDLARTHGVEKMWHPAKLRCGVNSVKSFRETSEPQIALQGGDLLFIDIGPVFNGYEGDVGATFVMTATGASATGHPLCEDVKTIWNRVALHWKTKGVNGTELYDFARQEAEGRGWLFNLEGASGHRIGDFPHHVHWRGTLRDFKQTASENLWILEIQIRDPKQTRGAFYEDILKCD